MGRVILLQLANSHDKSGKSEIMTFHAVVAINPKGNSRAIRLIEKQALQFWCGIINNETSNQARLICV